ncbi:hypothetical protein GPJ56_002455 [Histomonas meleagridis]|uniref:uncharacterized protein n=1 Tax=Histomonas meleagridis TaxID=135588 RepID=UPI0035595350|nr:hypothetical protein GPJ56_002455 [Histomonas meleagridis]KAH0798260.1 hypothetical protein GO595_008948 [Histomonas meleagridis]
MFLHGSSCSNVTASKNTIDFADITIGSTIGSLMLFTFSIKLTEYNASKMGVTTKTILFLSSCCGFSWNFVSLNKIMTFDLSFKSNIAFDSSFSAAISGAMNPTK